MMSFSPISVDNLLSDKYCAFLVVNKTKNTFYSYIYSITINGK